MGEPCGYVRDSEFSRTVPTSILTLKYIYPIVTVRTHLQFYFLFFHWLARPCSDTADEAESHRILGRFDLPSLYC